MSSENPVEIKSIFKTRWFELEAHRYVHDASPYYLLSCPDFVSVVATDPDGNFLIVKQFRASIQQEVYELPSGHIEPGEKPEESAVRELLEETGYQAGHVELLGGRPFYPDTGRMQNKMWCYRARNVIKVGDRSGDADEGVEGQVWSPERLVESIRSGEFNHALNLTALFYAWFENRIDLPIAEKGVSI